MHYKYEISIAFILDDNTLNIPDSFYFTWVTLNKTIFVYIRYKSFSFIFALELFFQFCKCLIVYLIQRG